MRRREYAVRGVSRNPRTGGLAEVRLTRTGFIQSFFDNPKLALAGVDTPWGVLALLERYVKAKSATSKVLGLGDERLPPEPVPACR